MKRLSLLSAKKKPRGPSHLSAVSNTSSPPPCDKNNDNSSEATEETSKSSCSVCDHEETSPLATIIIRNVDDSGAHASLKEKREVAQATPFNVVVSTMMTMLRGGSVRDSRGNGADTTGHGSESLYDYHDSEILVVDGKSNEDGVIVNDSEDDVRENDGATRSDGKPGVVELSPTSSTVSTMGVPVSERATGGGLKTLRNFVSNEVGNCSANLFELARDAMTGMNEIQNGNCLLDLMTDDDSIPVDRMKSIETTSGSVYSV